MARKPTAKTKVEAAPAGRALYRVKSPIEHDGKIYDPDGRDDEVALTPAQAKALIDVGAIDPDGDELPEDPEPPQAEPPKAESGADA